MAPPYWRLVFKGHCKTHYPTYTKKYGFDRTDGADYLSYSISRHTLEMNLYCVHCGTLLKISTEKFTLWKYFHRVGVSSFHRCVAFHDRLIIIVFFKEYGYLPISPVGWNERRSLSVTFNIKEANSKVAKCNLRKSNPNNYGLIQSVISDVN